MGVLREWEWEGVVVSIPLQTFEGRVSMEVGAQCDDTSSTFAEMALLKSVAINPATATGRRRLSRELDESGRRLSASQGDNTLCAGVIVNSNDATVGYY